MQARSLSTLAPRGARVAVAASALALAVVAAGCGSSSKTTAPTTSSSAPSAAQVLTVTAKDYSFDVPASVTGGLTIVNLINTGTVPHQLELLRTDPGVVATDLSASLIKDANSWIGKATASPGPNGILPGTSQSATVNLTPGNYVLVCFLRGGGGTGVPHVMLGMVKPMVVTTGPVTPPPPPVSDGQVTLQDNTITLPVPIKAGQHTFLVKNNGPQSHELNILSLNPGKTPADFGAFLQSVAGGGAPTGPPPFKNFGGLTALAPGTSAWVTLSFPPGNYVAADFVPDPTKGGEPHVAEGMRTFFTVAP